MSDQTFATARMLNGILFAVQVSVLTMLLASAAGAGQSATVELLGSGVDVSTPSWTQQAKLLAADGTSLGEHLQQYGAAIALSGNTALVTRLNIENSPVELAKAFVYGRDGETWTERAILEPRQPDGSPILCPTTVNGFFVCTFFGWSVALEGDLAVIGAPESLLPGAPVEGKQPGSVYVFERQNGQWSQQAVLTPSDGTLTRLGNQFGYSVDVSGDTILIGARHTEFDGIVNQGAAYVFVRDGEDWVEQAKLQPAPDGDWPNPPEPDCDRLIGDLDCPEFGYTVALQGDIALVGARELEVDGRRHHGAVYVFTREQGTWSQQTRLVPEDADDCRGTSGSCYFGASVSLSGNTALIGAHGAMVAGNLNAGAAYVFIHENGVWNEQAKLTMPEDDIIADGLGGGIHFGSNRDGVALEGDTALVGAAYGNVNGPDGDQGAAYFFRRESGSWSEPQRLTTPPHEEQVNSRFGYAVALSGATALISAWGYDSDPQTNTDEGAAYLFVDSDADLLFAPAYLNFGNVQAGQTSDPQIAILHNQGDEDLTGLNFSDPNNGFAADTGDCGATLAVGTSCEVSVTFTPDTDGAASATLQVDSDQGPAASLHLSGGSGGPVENPIFEDRFEQDGP